MYRVARGPAMLRDMKALTYTTYGPLENLAWTNVASPRPARGQLLVSVRCAALNPKDALFRKGRFTLVGGRRFPKRTGLDFNGVVIESRSRAFSAGDRVYGALDEWTFARGTLAEEVCVTDEEAAAIPDGVGDDAIAGLGLTGLTALQALRDIGRVRDGARVFIHGASGGVGTAAIQIARILGAEVTTTSSAANVGLCRELGAERALDYREEYRAAIGSVDVVLDAFGNLKPASVAPMFRGRGVFISTVPSAVRIARDVLTRPLGVAERLVVVKPRRADLETLATWLTEGRLRVVLDSRFPAVRVHDAFRVLESRRARGKIVVEVA